MAAPDLVDVETVAVLRKRWLAGMIGDARFAAAIRDVEDIELERYPALRFLHHPGPELIPAPLTPGPSANPLVIVGLVAVAELSEQVE